MSVQKGSLILLGVMSSFSSPSILAQQCASAAGNWSATYGYTWVLSQNSGQISGVVNMTDGCLTPQWPVLGSFIGNGQFNVRATNPNGSDQNCPAAWFEWSGSINKPGCHTGAGTWVNSLSHSNNWAWSKPCDVPTGESTSAVGWDPANATVFIWDAALAPSSKNFDGRTITESVSTGDGCWFSGSAFAKTTGAGGNPAPVVNNGYRDHVGYVSAAVTYYRAQGRAPCSFSSVQQVRIDCATSTPTFINNGLGGTIGTTTVSSSRAGQTQNRTWP